jgi:signal-transduction protein with cAMP-binding, CBS, and nucleotidyltransferase domain
MSATLTPPPSRHTVLEGPGRLDEAVRDIMRPGLLSLAEDASLKDAARAMTSHGVHAVLIVGSQTGLPLGWITSRGLLAWLDSDWLMPCSRAITEPPTYVTPSASAGDAVTKLSQPGVTHLLVARVAGHAPEGVVSDLDLVALGSRSRSTN